MQNRLLLDYYEIISRRAKHNRGKVMISQPFSCKNSNIVFPYLACPKKFSIMH